MLIGPSDLIPIDESAGMLRATVRTQTPDGTYESAERVWLLTFKEGLIYRQRVLESREEAANIYQQNGISLGMDRTSSEAPVPGLSAPTQGLPLLPLG